MDFEKLAKEIYDKKVKGKLSPKLLEHYASKLLAGTYEGYGTTLADSAISPEDKSLLKILSVNVYQFSGAKSYHELIEYNELLLNEKGDIRPWGEYVKLARQIHETYNVHYLSTEYQHAVNTSLMIKRWNNFWEERDTFPILTYEATLDERTEESHALLHGIKRRITDPFWDVYFPPLRYRCRCETTQTNEATEDELNKEVPLIDIPAPFRNNPAKIKAVFAKEWPYFEHMPEKDKKLLSVKNLAHITGNPLLKKLAKKSK